MSGARALGACGALLCATALLLAAPALYVPGLAMALAALVAPAWVGLSVARAHVTVRPAASSAYEDESVHLTVSVERGVVPFPRATLRLGSSAVALPAGRRRVQLELSAVASRRGRQILGPARLQVSDPFGIYERELRSSEHELLVLPRVYPIGSGVLSRLGGSAGPPSRARQAREIDGLRRYDPSEPASLIHWPTVARTGTLIGRGFVGEVDHPPLVILDAEDPESEQALDQALRAAASLCVHLAHRGGCELLLGDDRRASAIGPDLRGWPALHARLALTDAAAASAPRLLAQRGRTVLYVTASSRRAPASCDHCCRVGPRPLAGRGVAFTVAGCSAQLLYDGRQETRA